MGGATGSAICVIAAGLLYGTGHPISFFIAIISAIIAFGSWRYMRYFAKMLARNRLFVERLQSGELGTTDAESENATEYWEHLRKNVTMADANRRDIEDVPDFVSAANMFAVVVGIVMLIIGAVIRLS
jgi:hypothetical protein